MVCRYVSENDTIYYDKVPTDAQLPEGKCLSKVTPFVPPQVNSSRLEADPIQAQSIQIVQKKGAECCIQ